MVRFFSITPLLDGAGLVAVVLPLMDMVSGPDATGTHRLEEGTRTEGPARRERRLCGMLCRWRCESVGRMNGRSEH